RRAEFVVLDVVASSGDNGRASDFLGTDHEVHVAPALRAFVERVEPEEMGNHLLEPGMGIVETEADAVARKDIHLLEERFVEDPRLLEDATLLRDVILELRHGALRDSRRSS